ncbi:hypothetical protein Tco_1055101 [Tanacetum coccineum]|uniref:Uncharacterized protein n=1 Tax=Tanacetum coccineum TaxID=301880 RepID=A0ABQ5GZS8_9ASTR
MALDTNCRILVILRSSKNKSEMWVGMLEKTWMKMDECINELYGKMEQPTLSKTRRGCINSLTMAGHGPTCRDYSLSIGIFGRDKMSRDVIMVGLTMRIPLLYRDEYSQWRERFMNYLKEKMYGEAMIHSITHGEQPFPVVAQVSLAGTTPNAPPTLKDPKF